MNKTVEQIASRFKETEDTIQKAIDNLREVFPKLFAPFFEASNGEIKSISWNQYTEGWNDGEPCDFIVNRSASDIIINEEYDYDGEHKYLLNHISNALHNLKVSRFEELFGDGYTVTIHSDGRITKEDYEGD